MTFVYNSYTLLHDKREYLLYFMIYTNIGWKTWHLFHCFMIEFFLTSLLFLMFKRIPIYMPFNPHLHYFFYVFESIQKFVQIFFLHIHSWFGLDEKNSFDKNWNFEQCKLFAHVEWVINHAKMYFKCLYILNLKFQMKIQ